MPSSHLESTQGQNDVGRYMPSLLLGYTHGQTTSCVACHHLPWTTHSIVRHWSCNVIITWTTHTDERRRAWNAILLLGLHIWLDDMGVVCTHGPWQHNMSDEIGHDMPSSPLGSIHSHMMSRMTYYYRPWSAHTIRRRQA